MTKKQEEAKKARAEDELTRETPKELVKDFFKFILNANEWPEEKIEKNPPFKPNTLFAPEEVALPGEQEEESKEMQVFLKMFMQDNSVKSIFRWFANNHRLADKGDMEKIN